MTFMSSSVHKHETKTNSLFAAECMLQSELQQTTASIVQLQANVSTL